MNLNIAIMLSYAFAACAIARYAAHTSNQNSLILGMLTGLGFMTLKQLYDQA